VTSRTLKVLNTTGLHARPAGLFIETANRFCSAIRVTKGGREVDGKSVLGLMLLEITAGCEITITAEGEDERQAANALAGLITGRFGE
jgi:phosphotransferase system HPr (HPr) family protein